MSDSDADATECIIVFGSVNEPGEPGIKSWERIGKQFGITAAEAIEKFADDETKAEYGMTQ